MGIIKQGILGAFSGKVGTVIGGTWKGISYMRGIAPSYSNPQTPGQLAQRQKFALVISFLQPMTEFLKIGFKAFAVGQTAVNEAMSYNIRNAVAGVYPNFTINYANALVSKGNLAGALNAVAAPGAAGTVAFTWDDNSGEIGAAAADNAMIVVYNPVKHQAVTAKNLAQRSTGAQIVTVPDSFSGDTVQAYMAYQNAAGEVSESAFAGAVIVA